MMPNPLAGQATTDKPQEIPGRLTIGTDKAREILAPASVVWRIAETHHLPPGRRLVTVSAQLTWYGTGIHEQRLSISTQDLVGEERRQDGWLASENADLDRWMTDIAALSAPFMPVELFIACNSATWRKVDASHLPALWTAIFPSPGEQECTLTASSIDQAHPGWAAFCLGCSELELTAIRAHTSAHQSIDLLLKAARLGLGQ